MKTQAERFVSDRVAEIREFIRKMRLEYQKKCSPADWERVTQRAAQELKDRAEHLHDE